MNKVPKNYKQTKKCDVTSVPSQPPKYKEQSLGGFFSSRNNTGMHPKYMWVELYCM